ncbi:MAG: hypothetical protein N0E39_00465 [Candidatus Thiodiazotropha lotti]|nr:hypothetical protein [Candidatus Thiodiazotropha lotti]MCW4208809.1 hypothetical protein [Candidatus Thiodiazotropha lotti]MCW4209621.1 hypothetical protein [Candidatus Thiodiazotropha lotti]MCW4214272.1 hypothetical protein [Candidatus Thiodiazotropha lotti]
MAGIETDSDSTHVLTLITDLGQVLKIKTAGVSLSGGIFDHCGISLILFQPPNERIDNPLAASCARRFFQDRARVKVQQ